MTFNSGGLFISIGIWVLSQGIYLTTTSHQSDLMGKAVESLAGLLVTFVGVTFILAGLTELMRLA